MTESNQEGYRTLGWILNQSEQGLFLAIADGQTQKEIADLYRQSSVKIYDYKRNPGEYSFVELQKWVDSFPKQKTFLIVNFQLAIQTEESLKRLNFSRDQLEGLGKNIIFLVTSYGDDRLAVKAYDFYSFVKIRILFHQVEEKKERMLSYTGEEWNGEREEERAGSEVQGQAGRKRKRSEIETLLEQAKEELEQGYFDESERMLLKARNMTEELFGTEHLLMAEVEHGLADVYQQWGNYKKAEEWYQKSLQIREQVLGEEHPDVARSYNALAGVYEIQERYVEAEELYQKSLQINEKIWGEANPYTIIDYHDLAKVYEAKGDYTVALFYLLKVYKFLASEPEIKYLNRKMIDKELEAVCFKMNPQGNFKQWLEEKEAEKSEERKGKGIQKETE